ncbi:hypothetical protein O6H91_03G003300 [Diphasiastrum complanatum]|uniref:Uncharacterized protein n=1 Tax=Diphasiastrum complanatum TaxID=34168 RepID=A0ACC2E2Y3_DIPCM|nr:hypothetical protein O6H91_Y547200 [Diphasiastrum complanatum]KAJ7283033.1 hypothetical protein O6H91_Y352600 [Diphasiastrum complanatum]KAJ7560865.1 hypothetical protein O6H91_03G003300 [Diphasiastrum complanatum]
MLIIQDAEVVASDPARVDGFQARALQIPDGPATVLALGTANPPNAILQTDYPDFYFNATNSNHRPDLKAKFERICQKSGIKKRHFVLDDEIIQANPSICTFKEASLDARQDIAVRVVPQLAYEAASKAIEEWGQPLSHITHVVFATRSGMSMPGADLILSKLLGLRSNVRRIMLYHQGCFAGGSVMRVAKDLAENNKGSRVLVACSETTIVTFRAPSDEHVDGLVVSALFGDGASAAIVGSDPITGVEKPLFEIHWTEEMVVPESDGAVDGILTEAGLIYRLLKDVPGLISKNIGGVLVEALKGAGLSSLEWNDMFWAVHPGGRAILDQLERTLQLNPEKLRATREVLESYGNMSSACVLFVLDQVRRRSEALNLSTTGEGCEWGLLLGFGPGLTVETVLLKSISRST